MRGLWRYDVSHDCFLKPNKRLKLDVTDISAFEPMKSEASSQNISESTKHVHVSNQTINGLREINFPLDLTVQPQKELWVEEDGRGSDVSESTNNSTENEMDTSAKDYQNLSIRENEDESISYVSIDVNSEQIVLESR